ncbi:sensor domain-containing diguanylate cyclase [Niveibacterium sp. 24ML]|uniref:sensor domain-containing diguanylate cyclase n=1 Tax=Niveibacterium sp. 24ML TaxID=2985512 RepID=UPI00226E35B0|nr:sensor domain-containing diguanylate cyclase [Niveibacterium sp. 24ML]MCX9154721.1 sensor domain-containing diguanylate cyclase [Niveibacterium sp. 24ML]
MIHLLRRNLRLRAAAIIFLVGGLAGLCAALVSIPIVMSTERALMQRQSEALIDAVEDAVSTACFVDDRELAKQALAGLVKNPYLRGAEIRVDGRVIAAAGEARTAASVLSRAVHSPFSKSQVVCEIRVEPNETYTRERVYTSALRIAGLLAAQTAAVVLAALLAVGYFVTQPIRSISMSLHRIEAGAGGQIPMPRGHDADELGMLVRDTNHLISGFSGLIASERALRAQRERDEQRMRLIFENAETGLFTLADDGRLQSWNPACVSVLGGPLVGAAAPTLAQLLPSLAPALNALQQRCIERQRSVSEDFALREHDGQERWIQIVLTPASGGELQGLANDITDRKRAEEAAQELATTDSLTGAMNRLGLNRRLANMVAEHARDSARGFSLAMIDLDWFKQVNDTWGHEAGDHVLRVVAQRLERAVRRTDTVARLGGDEFVLLLDGVSEARAALTILEKVRDAVLAPIPLEGGAQARVGASIGVAVVSGAVHSPDELMRRADAAMYAGKKDGRNNTRVFSDTA